MRHCRGLGPCGGRRFVNCMGRALTISDDMYGYAMTTYRAVSTTDMNKKVQKVPE